VLQKLPKTCVLSGLDAPDVIASIGIFSLRRQASIALPVCRSSSMTRSSSESAHSGVRYPWHLFRGRPIASWQFSGTGEPSAASSPRACTSRASPVHRSSMMEALTRLRATARARTFHRRVTTCTRCAMRDPDHHLLVSPCGDRQRRSHRGVQLPAWVAFFNAAITRLSSSHGTVVSPPCDGRVASRRHLTPSWTEDRYV